MLRLADALDWSSRLLAFSLLLQTWELWCVRAAFGERGIWRPARLARGAWALGPRAFAGVLGAQVALASTVLVLGASPLTLLLVPTQLWIALRVGGPFNGGSDMLSLLSSLCLGVAAFVEPEALLARVAAGYLAAHVVLSYFIAGVAKLQHRSWRDGSALRSFAALPKYAVPAWAQAWLTRPTLGWLASASILLFECSFPLALLSPRFALAYLGLGVLFHLGNAALFGLNRFLLAWTATYPLLLALSQLGPLAPAP